ncbi:MAG: DUF4198 domain-containing protein [Bacteroidota bacterium]
MKHIFFLIAVLVVSLTTAQTADAHAIWIESNTKAIKNKAHEVKIIYGDYAEEIIEPTSKWYSDLKTLEVWVTSPSKKKTKLLLTDATDHLVSSFVPIEDGMYYITTVHVTKDLGGTTKYEFSSVASVLSGKASAEFAAVEQPLSVTVKPNAYKANDLIELQVSKDNQPFAKAEVQIMSPGGWIKTVKTNDKGQVSFTPKFKGNYIIEASEYKEEAGEWHAKKHTHVWKGSTTRILVN